MTGSGRFLGALWKQWVPLLTGGSLLALLAIWQWVGQTVPSWIYPTLLLVTLLVAGYRLWLAESRRADAAESALRANQEALNQGEEAEEHRRYRSLFSVVPCVLDTRTIELAWRGPLEDLDTQEPPHRAAPDELAAIYCALCDVESEPVQPIWAPVRGATAFDVWEVDTTLKRKRRIRSSAIQETDAFLRVLPRREPCLPFCPRCGRTSSGNYCPPCGSMTGEPVALKRCG